jgi:hypothetical protein
MESLEQPKAAAEVLLSGRQPGLATANRINRAVQLMPELPTAERERLLELALDQAAAVGAWSLVAEILDRQLALPPSEDSAKARARAAQRRARVSPRIDDAYGELGLRRQDPTARRRVQQLELQLRSPRAPGGHLLATCHELRGPLTGGVTGLDARAWPRPTPSLEQAESCMGQEPGTGIWLARNLNLIPGS